MMRVKTSGDDLSGYFVTITRDNPRSEEHMPLDEFLLRGYSAPPVAAQDEAPSSPVPDDDLPAFLRPKDGVSQTEPPPQRRVPIVDPVGDAIHAMNDIETRLTGAVDEMRQRIDRIEAAAAAPVDSGHDEAIKSLTSYLDGLSAQVARATSMATEALKGTRRATPADDPREAAKIKVRNAAAEVRSRNIGNDADDRDTVHRLVEIALNARAGNSLSIAHMEAIGDAAGRAWGDVAKEIITNHDRASAVTVRTHIVEVRALADLASAPDDQIEAIVATAIHDLQKAGE